MVREREMRMGKDEGDVAKNQAKTSLPETQPNPTQTKMTQPYIIANSDDDDVNDNSQSPCKTNRSRIKTPILPVRKPRLGEVRGQ